MWQTGGDLLKKNNVILSVCAVAFSVNAVLFFVKLYIGLRTNSISIYSDAVNNLFDSLSGLITLISLGLILKNKDTMADGVFGKTEQLYSLFIAIAVCFTGLYFAYSSLERLMYPTPVWYTGLYLGILIFTALIKLGLFFFYRTLSKKSASPVIKVMSFDSILDFFITSVTAFTLYLSGSGNFAFDAVFGIVISAAVIVSAVRLIITNAKALVDFVPQEKRDELKRILEAHEIKADKISFRYLSGSTEAYICTGFIDESNILVLKKECEEKTGIILNIII